MSMRNVGVVRLTALGALGIAALYAVRLGGDGVGFATSASAWPTIPCVIALVIAARRSGRLTGSVVGVGLVVAVLHAVTAAGFARSGALSPSGVAMAAPPAFAIWMVVIAVTLLRNAAPVRVAAPVAA